MIKLTNETMTRPYTPRGMKRMIRIRGCAIFKPQITVAYVGEFGMKTKDKKKRLINYVTWARVDMEFFFQ